MINLSRPISITDFPQHRSGWPFVAEHLQKYHEQSAILFDDFVEATYSYRPIKSPVTTPWIGIFHHPPVITSVLERDRTKEVRRVLENNRFWGESKRHLRAAICLSDYLAQSVSSWLNVPVLSLRHPTDLNVPMWDKDLFFRNPTIFQVGFFLRDTRAIFRIPNLPKEFTLARSRPYIRWQVRRDRRLFRKLGRSEFRRAVVELNRLDDTGYDAMLARSVMLTHLFGASANNVVVECIARSAPLLVNRLEPVVEYLGQDYPLWYDHLSEIPGLLTPQRILDAHYYLEGMDKSFLEADWFACRVAQFSEQFA